MATDWFYQQGERQIGPVATGDLRRLARVGTVTPDTLVRKEGSPEWVRASRIKGLFADSPAAAVAADPAEPESGSPLNSLFAGVSGLAESLKKKVSSKPAEPAGESLPAELADRVRPFVTDQQDPAVVARLLPLVEQILTSNEQVLYFAIQAKPVVNLFPDAVVLTNRRFIVYRPKMLGRIDFEDYIWRDLHDVRLEENLIGATISFQPLRGAAFSLDYLPKVQARAVYRIAQEQEELVREERRARAMEETRAGAPGVFIQNRPLAAGTATVSASSGDPVKKLQQLKRMLDDDLITQAEYDAKKTEILKQM